MQNISGFGAKVTVVATVSFPVGFDITQFADDKDPLKIEEVELTGFELLIDGSLFTFNKGAAIKVEISVIPGSDDDINLKILLQAKKGSVIPLPDVTSIAITYGNGGIVGFSAGAIVSGPLADSISSDARLVGNRYTFVFGEFSGAQSVKEIATDVGRALIGAFA